MSEILLPHAETMTPEEYFAFEEFSEVTHEYVDGRLYAMASATRAHSTIAINIASELKAALRGTSCRPYNIGVKVRIRSGGQTFYYYPDITVDCSGSRSAEIEEPTAIFEVLSRSTERVDR